MRITPLTDENSYYRVHIEIFNRKEPRNMQPSYRFFENRACKYFPCHSGLEGKDFNCLFCYCPMYRLEQCQGNPRYKELASGKKIKVCTDCIFPHRPENYDKIMKCLAAANEK